MDTIYSNDKETTNLDLIVERKYYRNVKKSDLIKELNRLLVKYIEDRFRR